jgi:hypothetical protein
MIIIVYYVLIIIIIMGRQLGRHLANDLFLALDATDRSKQANSCPSVQMRDRANSTKLN